MENALLKTSDVAEFLQTNPQTLRAARMSGFLWGVPGPSFKKFGRVVRYEKQAIQEFLESVSSQRVT